MLWVFFLLFLKSVVFLFYGCVAADSPPFWVAGLYPMLYCEDREKRLEVRSGMLWPKGISSGDSDTTTTALSGSSLSSLARWTDLILA